jgi:hypothetical protein
MGNAGFWLDTILMDENITPKNETFKADKRIREALCLLVWDKNQQHTLVEHLLASACTT